MTRRALSLLFAFTFFVGNPGQAVSADGRGKHRPFIFLVQYRGLPTHVNVSALPIRKTVLTSLVESVDGTGSMSEVELQPVALPVAGVRLAQVSPSGPYTRGCGLLSIDIPEFDTQLSGVDNDPDRQGVVQLRGTDKYSQLSEDLRQVFERRWGELEMQYAFLTSHVHEIQSLLNDANTRANQLDAQGCQLARDYNQWTGRWAAFKAKCAGTLPNDLLAWCAAEQNQIKADFGTLQARNSAMSEAAKGFLDSHAKPLVEKDRAAVAEYENYRLELQKLKDDVQRAVDDDDPECWNRISFYVQRASLQGTAAKEKPAFDPVKNADAEKAFEEIHRFAGYYGFEWGQDEIRLNGFYDAIGRAVMDLGKSEPPAKKYPYVFSPGPKDGRYVLIVDVEGIYPITRCRGNHPKKPAFGGDPAPASPGGDQ